MTTFVLVHGAFVGGGWCWDKVKPLLEEHGHTAVAPDLPGSGSDRTSLKDVTLEKYVNCVVETINKQSEPVVLVAHSLGGISISAANEVVPDKISKLVYISAYLLANGESNLSKTQEPEHASSKLPAWIELTEDAINIKPEGLEEVFCADCSAEDVALLRAKGQPQALKPSGTPISVNPNPDTYREKRFYIETTQDQCVPNAIQRKMYTALPCQRVMTMDTSHSPFFAAPEKLVSYLLNLD